jgi:hypothetical protein
MQRDACANANEGSVTARPKASVAMPEIRRGENEQGAVEPDAIEPNAIELDAIEPCASDRAQPFGCVESFAMTLRSSTPG